MNENEATDAAAEAQADHESMVEATIDKEWNRCPIHHGLTDCVCVPEGSDGQPQATDFTEIRASCTEDGYFDVWILLERGNVTFARHLSREEAETAVLVITQAMIEYRTKRNAWEKSRLLD